MKQNCFKKATPPPPPPFYFTKSLRSTHTHNTHQWPDSSRTCFYKTLCEFSRVDPFSSNRQLFHKEALKCERNEMTRLSLSAGSICKGDKSYLSYLQSTMLEIFCFQEQCPIKKKERKKHLTFQSTKNTISIRTHYPSTEVLSQTALFVRSLLFLLSFILKIPVTTLQSLNPSM